MTFVGNKASKAITNVKFQLNIAEDTDQQPLIPLTSSFLDSHAP